MNKYAVQASLMPNILQRKTGEKLLERILELAWSALSQKLDESAKQKGINLTLVISEIGAKPTDIKI